VRLVLLYHRIEPRDVARYELISTIPRDLFREQLSVLGELGRIVPLQAQLDDPPDAREPLRMALTFDDDYASHRRYVLPILRDLGLHATFFLSGRALHDLGAYWFQRLESLVAERGLRATAELLGLGEVVEAQLPLHCEGDPRRLALIDRHAPEGEPPLDGAGISELVEAGMAVGFHTLDHPVLPLLEDDALRAALNKGRDELAGLVGRPLDWLAYPHGKADARTVQLTAKAGFAAAWTTQPRVLRPTDDRLQLGRWEAQPLSTDEVLILIGRLLRRASRLG
jgi:peptidoglycan/xylan/chitin deacetylase (PgdA/CDA1 family)